jgi:hypothetical protein
MRTKANNQVIQHPVKKDHVAEREVAALELAKAVRHWAEQLGCPFVGAAQLYGRIQELVRQRQNFDRAKRDHWRLVGERAKVLVLTPLAA